MQGASGRLLHPHTTHRDSDRSTLSRLHPGALCPGCTQEHSGVQLRGHLHFPPRTDAEALFGCVWCRGVNPTALSPMCAPHSLVHSAPPVYRDPGLSAKVRMQRDRMQPPRGSSQAAGYFPGIIKGKRTSGSKVPGGPGAAGQSHSPRPLKTPAQETREGPQSYSSHKV